MILALILISACSDLRKSGNWPQFRGPEANMLVTGENLPTQWSDDLNVAWTYALEGEGWASPVIWENQVLVTTVVAEKINKPGEGREDNQNLFRSDVYRWELTCLDMETGEALWKKTTPMKSCRRRIQAIPLCGAGPQG